MYSGTIQFSDFVRHSVFQIKIKIKTHHDSCRRAPKEPMWEMLLWFYFQHGTLDKLHRVDISKFDKPS
jgi:hypothetical protein